MNLAARIAEGHRFDVTFAAQRDGSAHLQSAGVPCTWLPLACNPDLHYPHATSKHLDIGFVGHLLPGRREHLVALLQRRYRATFFGQAYGDELAKIYSASKIGFNCSVSNDVNMRVFEAMACGTALLTNQILDNGQEELFRDGVHLVTYGDDQELLDKLAFYLRNDSARESVARRGREEVVAHHTYEQRMRSILQALDSHPRLRNANVGYNRHERPLGLEDVDVIIKSFLRPRALLRLLRSIRTFYPHIAITVADDGDLETAGDDASRECRQEMLSDPHCRLVALPFDSGVSRGRNALIEATSRRAVLILDDDSIFTEQTRIERLLDRLNADTSLGVAAGLRIDIHPHGRELRRSQGTLRQEGTTLFHDTSGWRDAGKGICDFFPTFALIRREVFDEGIHWRGGIGADHYDFCLQVQQSHWSVAIEESVTSDHDQHVPCLPGYVERRLDYEAPQQWLLQTWQIDRIVQDGSVICERHSSDADAQPPSQHPLPGEKNGAHFEDYSYFHFPRPDVLNLVPRSAKRVLDIGCAAGLLGASIKSRQAAQVFGIDSNPTAAQLAATRLDGVHCIDVETAAWPFPERHFDCVILADVIEHLRDPESLLTSVRRSLTDDGVIVASIPNVRHHSVLAALLDGHWTYEAAGLLDHTHVRFFTRREIEKFLYRAGFSVEAEYSKLGPHDEGQCRPEMGQVRLGSLTISNLPPQEVEELFTYQYLIVARPQRPVQRKLTSIVVLTHNQLAYTQMCLNSIRMRTDEPYELIVVDNGSTDGTVQYLRSLRGIKLIENPDNRGFPAGVNQGLRAATGDQALLLNNDTIVTTGWLARMLDCLESGPQVGLVGPVSNNVCGTQCVGTRYDDITKLDGFAWDWGKAHDRSYQATERLIGFCLLIRREVMEKIGVFDERFGIGTFEDDDFCLRAIQAGFQCLIATDSFVHHFGNQTFRASGQDLHNILTHNRKLFEDKWSGADGTRGNGVAAIGASATDIVAIENVEPPRAHNGLVALPHPSGTMQLRRSRPTVSLCMIVRNNERTIDACLASIRPWVDELIVVDTGSTDQTPAIAKKHGARLFHFPWPDSFATARNESLRHATGDWIFWMDSDDTISAENGRKLRELPLHTAPASVLGYIMQVHCPGAEDVGNADVTVVDHIKLFRNRADLRFEGRIHEQIMPAIRRAGGETAWTDIFVVHSGSDHSAAGQRVKQERDLRLLKMEEQEHPDHSFVLFNIGMTLADMNDHAGAIQYLNRSIAVADISESHLRKAYALLIASHIQRGEFTEAERACQAGRTLFPHDPELWFREGFIAHQLGQHDKAVNAYSQALLCEDAPHFSSIDRGIRGYKTRHNLALVYEQQGRLEIAEQELRAALQEAPLYRPTRRALANNLLVQKKFAELGEELNHMAAEPSLAPETYLIRHHIAKTRTDFAAARRELESGVKRFPAESCLLESLCQLLFECGSPTDAEGTLCELLKLEPHNGAAWHNLGSIYLRLNDGSRAEHALREALRFRPNQAVTHVYLGFALEQQGKAREAYREWQRASELTPDDPLVKEAYNRIPDAALT